LLPLLAAIGGLASLPWLTLWWREAGAAPSLREWWVSSVASLFAIGFGAWVIVLLRREREASRRHLADLEALTLTDALTGLGNRRALERAMSRLLLRSRRTAQPLSLLALDLRGLRELNARFGQASGDEMLRALAHAVRDCSRAGVDGGFRVAGDDFVVVVGSDREGAERLAGRIRAAFQERAPHEGLVTSAAVEWDGAMTAGEMLSAAERARVEAGRS
jgi:diguanylate cyclase (GGDEF)-like protein